jgi:deferrochelatase/peroxidase EfeB
VDRTGSAHFERGDFVNTDPFLVEAKACARIELAAFVDQVAKAAKKQSKLPVVIIKRRNKPVGDAYVVMQLADWIAMLKHFNQP